MQSISTPPEPAARSVRGQRSSAIVDLRTQTRPPAASRANAVAPSPWLRACSAAIAANQAFQAGNWNVATRYLLRLRRLPDLRPADIRWIDRQLGLCRNRGGRSAR
jgi:hypothetical protein